MDTHIKSKIVGNIVMLRAIKGALRYTTQGQEFAKGEFLTLGCNSRRKQRPQRGRVSQLIASSQ